MVDLAELNHFLATIEQGGAVPAATPGESAFVARVRALLEQERARAQGLSDLEGGLETLANGLMQLALGDFSLSQQAMGDNPMLDASYVGLTMLAEELTHSRAEMVAARDDALAANRSKSVFLANMSHELRTPLNAIIGYCELLSDELTDVPETDRYQDDLTRILSAARHLLGLLSDILDLSKIEAGRLEVTLLRIEPAAIIREVCSSLQSQAHQRSTTLRCDVPDDFRVRADPGRLKQILFNLVGNAVKFTENGTIHVRAFTDARGGHLAVRDDGRGIPTDRHEAIFEPFVQADDQTNVLFGGTGLGLAITRRLCRLMGGDVALESAPGHGSTFTVTLPVD